MVSNYVTVDMVKAGTHISKQSNDTSQLMITQFDDLQQLNLSLHYLKMSSWFYDSIDCYQAESLLTDTLPGTFLVRESSNSGYLFAITVQTHHKKPTSIRIKYNGGLFSLDTDTTKNVPPQFECVHDLVEFYTLKLSNVIYRNRFGRIAPVKQVFYDERGAISWLTQPVRDRKVASLSHLTRIVINRRIVSESKHRFELSSKVIGLPLPKSLITYLLAYPFPL